MHLKYIPQKWPKDKMIWVIVQNISVSPMDPHPISPGKGQLKVRFFHLMNMWGCGFFRPLWHPKSVWGSEKKNARTNLSFEQGRRAKPSTFLFKMFFLSFIFFCFCSSFPRLRPTWTWRKLVKAKLNPVTIHSSYGILRRLPSSFQDWARSNSNKVVSWDKGCYGSTQPLCM